MAEPRYESHAEHAGIHGSPKWQSSGTITLTKHLKVTNGTQRKLHIPTQLVSKTPKPCNTPYETPLCINTLRDCWPARL